MRLPIYVQHVRFSLKQIRAKVWKARTTSTLFDVKQYCRDMEDLLYRMWRRFEGGTEPDHLLIENDENAAVPSTREIV